MDIHRAKVLVVVKGLGLGGAEKLISGSARFWNRDRFDYQVAYALPWKNHLVPSLAEQGIPVHCVGTFGATSIPSVWGLRRLVGSWRPDVIHAHLPTMGIAVRWFTDTLVVYTEHNLTRSYHPLTRLVNQMSYRRNAAVIAVSQAVADSVATYQGPSPIVVLNAVDCRPDPHLASMARIELGIKPDAQLVVHVGNMRPNKGHENLIHAARVLKEDMPHVVVVSIGGEKRAGDHARISALAAELGLEGTIRFLGRRDDALSFVEAADVFVNPADIEGLPVSILEAMALGRPVVATSVGGVPKVIESERNGLLVDPRAPAELAAAIKRLLVDRNLAKNLAREALIDVKRDYGLERMVHEVESVYEKVLRR